MVSILIGTAFSKCKYAVVNDPEIQWHQVLDLCIADYSDSSIKYSSYQYLCDKNEIDETEVIMIQYSDANCQNQVNSTVVTEMLTDIHCELQDECDYIQWATWKTKKGEKCGSGKPYKEQQYSTNNFLNVLDNSWEGAGLAVGECNPDTNGYDVSSCTEVESCGDGIKEMRIIQKEWNNKDCSGEPAKVQSHESDSGRNSSHHWWGECTRFIQCSPDSTITSKKCPGSKNLTSQGPQSSSGIMDNKVVIVCASVMVILGVIYGISSMF